MLSRGTVFSIREIIYVFWHKLVILLFVVLLVMDSLKHVVIQSDSYGLFTMLEDKYEEVRMSLIGVHAPNQII